MTVDETAAELTTTGDWFTRHLAMAARGYDDKGQPYPNRAPRDRLRAIAAQIEDVIATAYRFAGEDRAEAKRHAYRVVQIELGGACGVWPTSTGRYGELVAAHDWSVIASYPDLAQTYRRLVDEYQAGWVVRS